MTSTREWMYKIGTREFYDGIEDFMKQADSFARSKGFVDGTVQCPCNKCKNLSWKGIEDAKYDLYRYGFVPNYYAWDKHGEQPSRRINRELPNRAKAVNLARNMVIDAAGSQFEDLIFEAPTPSEPPNPAAKRFFDLLSKADAPLYKGFEGHSTLSATSRMLNIKSDFNMSQTCYNRVMQAIKEFIPNSTICPNYYESKKMVSQLGLGYIKIDCCPNGCMLYYGKQNEVLDKCYKCDHARYKPKEQGSSNGRDIPYKYMHYLPITPRLQRLYMSKETAQHMTWHHEYKREPGVLSHPSDGEAWKKFDQIHSPFAAEPRNVRLGLCTDGFTPFGMSSTSYSCWPVIVTPYNLPPWMCMKKPYMFLTLIIPGPHCPKKNIDVFLQPLIDELYVLWKDGVDTYDAFRERNFNLKAALMWTINDFPAYGMLSGWSTHGRLSCPYCMEKSKAFHLKHGGKTSFFDCHRQYLPMDHPFRRNKDSFTKGRVENDAPPPRLSGRETWRRVCKYPKVTDERYPTKDLPGFGVSHNWTKKSILWDLPYWNTNLLRHNIDVMHVEKNVFDNIFYTVMDDKDKTKDNVKARQDVKLYCRRRELELVTEANGKTLKPKALYTLNKEQKKVVLQWVKNLKFPDGYASNLSRCVDLQRCKMWGMKSHDCHVFMERLLPIALREMLPEPIWKAMTEVSLFFRDLCSTTLRVEQLEKMEKNIVVTMCKLEKILPPGFFDHMEHLLVHLSYEAKVGGPVQYRWMYPFERYLYHLKKKVKNKARVESSICEAYIMEEISNFCTHYFESHVETNSRKVGRNDDGGNVNPNRFSLSIFNHRGRPSGTCKRRFLDDDEYAVATFYVLQNCEEIQPFIRKFEAELKVKMPNITTVQLTRAKEERFGRWIRDYVLNPLNSNLVNDNLKSLAIGPSRHARTWQLYYVNGFNFHTLHHSFGRKTSNTDLCIVGEEGDYYGQLSDVIELEYLNCSKVVLFKCEWFDPVKHRGWKIHNEFGLVDINHKKKLRNYDPFIMAHQAQQVYFISYPSMRKDKNDWWAVCRTKARSTIVAPTQQIDYAYQEDGTALPFIVTENDEAEKLHDDDGNMEVVEVQHLQADKGKEVENVIEEEDESEEEEELEYEYSSEEDNESNEKDEWLDNFSDDSDF